MGPIQQDKDRGPVADILKPTLYVRVAWRGVTSPAYQQTGSRTEFCSMELDERLVNVE
jgi:hypothetical protein